MAQSQKHMPRVETGPIKFGDDWTGVFIRGDRAFGIVQILEIIKRGIEEGELASSQMKIAIASLHALVQLLKASDENTPTNYVVQRLLPFPDCLS